MKLIALFLALVLAASFVAAQPGERDPTMVGARAEGKIMPIKANLKVDFEVAKERYLAMKENYTNARERYIAEKEKFQNRNLTKPNRNSTENFEKDKEYLLAAADKILAQLERLKDAADANNKTDASASMQSYIDAIADIKVKINASATIDELKEQGKELRRIWQSAQNAVARNHGLILANKLENLVDRMENAVEKINSRLGNLSDKGYNVTGADVKIDAILDLLAQADQKIVDAKAEFALVTGSPGNDEHWRKGHALLKEANEFLRQAHKSLVDFLKDVRGDIRKEAREEVKEKRMEIKDRLKDKLDKLKMGHGKMGKDDEEYVNVTANVTAEVE